MFSFDRLVPRTRRARCQRACAGCAAPIALSAETFHLNNYELHRCQACGSLVTLTSAPDA